MSEPKKYDIRLTEPALRRAGMRALWLGKRLGHPVFVYRDGKIMDATLTDPEPTEEQMRYVPPKKD